MNVSLDVLAFDWFILILRGAIVFLIYWFLWRVARVSLRELLVIGAEAKTREERMPAGPSETLQVLDPGNSSTIPGATFHLEMHSSIGRLPDNTIVLDDDSVSGHHAEIDLDESGWSLLDSGSRNHTFVNGVMARGRVRLNDGDTVQFGRVRLRVNL